MIVDLVVDRPNRAVSPLFRAFGGFDGISEGERRRRASFPGGHPVECLVLGLLFPLIVGGGVFDGLLRATGWWPAVVLTLPATFLMLHIMAFGLRLKTPQLAFWGWALICSAWAGWLILQGGPSPVLWLAWGWCGFLGLQVLGFGGLIWQRVMKLAGPSGVAVRVGIALGSHLMIWPVWHHFGQTAGLGLGALLGGLWALGTFRPGNQMFGPVARRHGDPGVLLTFDDGPDPADTPAILDLLDRYHTKAVFFVIGEKVSKYPELARCIVERGHRIGNHTMTHPQACMWRLGPGHTRREIESCQEAVEAATGVVPAWFRAPVGHRNWFTHPVTRQHGLTTVAWSKRAYDTAGTDVPALTKRLTSGVGNGDILLLHESTPIAVELAGKVLEELDQLRLLPKRSGDC